VADDQTADERTVAEVLHADLLPMPVAQRLAREILAALDLPARDSEHQRGMQAAIEAAAPVLRAQWYRDLFGTPVNPGPGTPDSVETLTAMRDGYAAKIRADERAKVAEELRAIADAAVTGGHVQDVARRLAGQIAREHATEVAA